MKNALSLACASIRARSVYAYLTILSVAAGLAMICAIFLLAQGLHEGLSKNLRGVDIVIGAKGSKLQLVLSSIYHADIPNGNIEIAELDRIKKNPQIRTAIPIAMGDSYKGYRVIGTTTEFLNLYQAKPAEGRIFEKPFEVIAGASTGLTVGAKFAAVHGFSADGTDVHDFQLYEIVGVLKPSGTVIDKLLLTPVESVQQLHAHHEEHEEGESESEEDHALEEAMAHQITAILVKTRGPAAIMNLPRQINKRTNLLAANPGYEMARLSANFGVGKNILLILSCIVLGLSVLMLFSNLASGLSARQYDLAVLRVLGAGRRTLFLTVMFEGILIGLSGAVVGIFSGHLLAYLIASNVTALQGFILPTALWAPQSFDGIILLTGILAGFAASLLPALSALKLDITNLLVRGT